MREVYQKLYTETDYGRAAARSCPGLRYFTLYQRFLTAPVYDLGCGTGETVQHLRKEGFESLGCDWIDLNNGMDVADITKPLDLSRYKTAICIDVLEHLQREKMFGIFRNFAQVETVVASVHTGSSKWRPDNHELHINRRKLKEWENLFRDYFEISDAFCLESKRRKLYILRTTTESRRLLSE